MTGGEIDIFTARLARFTAKGVTHTDGEALADKLVARDRESDDRRLCLECAHLAGYAGTWSCRNWQWAGVALKARDAAIPRDLVQMLQRCDGFKSVATGCPVELVLCRGRNEQVSIQLDKAGKNQND